MSRWNLAWLVGITAAALLSISLTYSAPTHQAGLQKNQHNRKLLMDVLDEVQKKYVRELDQDKMRELVENMINGGLERLDPHSGFMGADEYKHFRTATRGKFGGVGIRLDMDRTGRFLVESPIAGSPADEAGIRPGDVILKVDGKSLENWKLKDVVENIQGKPDTEVTLTVLHEGDKKPVDITMKRGEIKIENIMGDQRSKVDLKEWDFWIDPETKIAYVRIQAFNESTTQELTRIVEVLQRTGLRGLIVDLRTNPGGLLESAVGVSSLFLPEGKNVVTTKGRGNTVEKVYNSENKGGKQENYAIAILINHYSASASEIVAAALQDHARAVIIGERSYGKGSVQNLIEMEDATSALKLTTASYWRPSGRNIHRFPDSKEEDDWGVKPDKGFEIKLSDEERADYFKWRRERDVLRRQGPNGKEPDPKLKDFRDRVLDKAVEHLRGEIARKAGGAQAPAAPAVRPNPGAQEDRRPQVAPRGGIAMVTDRFSRAVA